MIRDGPVRVKINGRNIHKINGFVEVFFVKAGHEIKFVAEGGNKGQSPPDPPQPKKPDEGSDVEGEDSERDTELEWENMRKQFKNDNPPTSQGVKGPCLVLVIE